MVVILAAYQIFNNFAGEINFNKNRVMKHILLQKAFTYKKREIITAPVGYEFDSFLGAWVSLSDKSLLVNHKDFPGQGTKKNDMETGEDMKGQ